MKEENIEDNLVFRINRRKTFALKLIQKNYFSKSVTLEQNTFIFYFICLLLVYYITKQTVYQNKFTRKSRFRFERSDDEDLGNPLSFPPPPPPPPPTKHHSYIFQSDKKNTDITIRDISTWLSLQKLDSALCVVWSESKLLTKGALWIPGYPV